MRGPLRKRKQPSTTTIARAGRSSVRSFHASRSQSVTFMRIDTGAELRTAGSTCPKTQS